MFIIAQFIIYIPIWLDLLLRSACRFHILYKYLHSNMVRFIIVSDFSEKVSDFYLHSNMVRFIIIFFNYMYQSKIAFTFQYG